MDTNEQSDNRVITLNGVTYHRLENITYLKKLPHADSDDDNDLDSTWLITKLKHCEAGEIIYAEIDDAFLSHYTYLYFPIEPSTVDPQWLEKTCQQTPDESLITCDVVLDKPMGKIPADIELDWKCIELKGSGHGQSLPQLLTGSEEVIVVDNQFAFWRKPFTEIEGQYYTQDYPAQSMPQTPITLSQPSDNRTRDLVNAFITFALLFFGVSNILPHYLTSLTIDIPVMPGLFSTVFWYAGLAGIAGTSMLSRKNFIYPAANILATALSILICFYIVIHFISEEAIDDAAMVFYEDFFLLICLAIPVLFYYGKRQWYGHLSDAAFLAATFALIVHAILWFFPTLLDFIFEGENILFEFRGEMGTGYWGFIWAGIMLITFTNNMKKGAHPIYLDSFAKVLNQIILQVTPGHLKQLQVRGEKIEHQMMLLIESIDLSHNDKVTRLKDYQYQFEHLQSALRNFSFMNDDTFDQANKEQLKENVEVLLQDLKKAEQGIVVLQSTNLMSLRVGPAIEMLHKYDRVDNIPLDDEEEES